MTNHCLPSSSRRPVCAAVWTLLGTLFLCPLAAHAQAQVQPSAGDVQRSVVPPLAPTPHQDVPPAVKVSPAIPEGASGASAARIPVRALRITGATVVSESVLQALLSDVPGRSFTLAELQHVLQRVGDYYRNAGYPVARAVLPAQDVHDGVVTVLVLEGRIGAVSFDNQSLISEHSLMRLFGEVPASAVVSQPELERRLLLLGDTPGASRASAVLQPGRGTGETDVRVQVDGADRAVSQVDFDNHGNRYTGYWRMGAQTSINSPAGLGDQFQLRGQLTNESLNYVRLGYRLPVYTAAWTVGTAWSQVNYKLAREFAYLDAKGWARTGTVDTSYALVRTPDYSLNAVLAWDHKTFEDRIEVLSPALVTRKTSDVLSLAFNGYGGRASRSYAFSGVWSHGQLKLPTVAQQAADDAGPRTRGGFDKLVATGNMTVSLDKGWSVYATAYWQRAFNNLDASEKLSLGGATGVRAYPQGEASGDQGQLGSVELRYTPPLSTLQWAGFLDAGHVRFDHDTYTSGATERSLYAIGASLLWGPRQDLGFKLMVATRLGPWAVQSEPDSRSRLWLQGLWRF